ncbi:MAG: hypothetical protein WC234_00795 [Endomicrobiaceae bacterium]
MNIKSFTVISILFLFSSSVFAKEKTVVFFCESIESVSPKVMQKIHSSLNFCFAASINGESAISDNLRNLITENKTEPVLRITQEPYIPLISSKIPVSSEIFNRTEDLDNLLAEYQKKATLLFGKPADGIFLKNAFINEDSLDIFHDNDILWTTAEIEDASYKGCFKRNKVTVFVPYKDFPKTSSEIQKWFSDKQEKIIPVVLTKDHLKNSDLMLYMINFLNKSKTFGAELPVTVANEYEENADSAAVKFKCLGNISQDIILKLLSASNEVDENSGREDLYPTLHDELTTMYSFDIIKKLLNNDIYAGRIFNISYSNIFKLSGKEVPSVENLMKVEAAENADETSGQTDICSFIRDGDSYTIYNDGIIKSLNVNKDEHNIFFSIDTDFSLSDFIDIYIDMNGIAYTGSQNMLKGIEGFFVPENCWEYAVRISPLEVKIYRFAADTVTLIKTIGNNNSSNISVPANILKGSVYNWSYQVVTAKNGEITDFLETEKNKTKILNTVPIQLKMFKYIQ